MNPEDLQQGPMAQALRNFLRDNADALDLPSSIGEDELGDAVASIRRDMDASEMPTDIAAPEFMPRGLIEGDPYEGPWSVTVEPSYHQTFEVVDGIFAYGGAWPKLSDSTPTLSVTTATLGITSSAVYKLYAELAYGGPKTQGALAQMVGNTSEVTLKAHLMAREDDARRSHPGDVFQRQVLGEFTTYADVITSWTPEWEYGHIQRQGTSQGVWLPVIDPTGTASQITFLNPLMYRVSSGDILTVSPNMYDVDDGSPFPGTQYIYVKTSIDNATGSVTHALAKSNIAFSHTTVPEEVYTLIALAWYSVTSKRILEVIPTCAAIPRIARYHVVDPDDASGSYHLLSDIKDFTSIYDLSNCVTNATIDTFAATNGVVTTKKS